MTAYIKTTVEKHQGNIKVISKSYSYDSIKHVKKYGENMSVRKPLQKEMKKKVDVEELIDRGAPVKGEAKMNDPKKWTVITLRMSDKMLSDVDEAVSRRVGISRTGWILEAIHEKMSGWCNDH